MEDDDEFGDLYTDVLRPFPSLLRSPADAPAPLRTRPIDPDANSDDEETLFGAADLKNSISDPISAAGIKSNAEETLAARPEFGRFDLNLDSNSRASEVAGRDCSKSELPVNGLSVNFVEEDDDLNIVVEEIENKEGSGLVEKPGTMFSSAELKENETGSQQIIPGLSVKLDNQGNSNFEDQWDSDESEDDLQIVLNDSNNGPMGMMERMPGVDGQEEDNEDGEQLVILADNGEVGHHQPPMVDEQEWKGEEMGPRVDGERKDPGDVTKAGGGPTKIGYSNHLHHHQFHSQFKYVRPGAMPLPGTVPENPGGIQGHVRPPISMGPGAGRGRGDWRPRPPFPMQKGIQPGYGMPVSGSNTAGRGYGSGLDFTLPSHKTIFEVDIDGFEEKPWRLPGIDISDFFNFGLIEDSWKDYCKQLEHLRLETTMQSKIRAYESRRTEHEYDPDLPPELAAAVGNQDVPYENANGWATGDGSSGLARSMTHVPQPIPIGRPIPVEIALAERQPTIDTKRIRMHDSDAIIQIVCQSSNDDDVAEQLKSDSGGENPDDIDDQKGEIVANREKFVRRDEIGSEGSPHETSNDDDDDGERQILDNTNKSSDNEDGKDQSMALAVDVNDISFDTDREDLDMTTDDVLEDGKLVRPSPRDKLSQENDKGEEDSKVSKRSNDDRLRGSVKIRSDEDKPQTKGRHQASGKGRENPSRSQRGGALLNSSSLHRNMNSENEEGREKIREIGSRGQQSRSQMDNGSRVLADHNQDMVGSKQRDMDAAHDKRRKEYGEKDVTYNHREGRRKRERDDDMNYSISQKKEESSLQKERGRDVWHNRNKPPREREETRPVVRRVEDKKWAGHSRGRDDYKGSGRENIGRHNDQVKKRDRGEDDVISRNRGHEKSDEHRREGNRKRKEFEGGEQGSVLPSKRNRDEQSGQMNETVNPRRHPRETSLDDDEQPTTEARRGRSKLERWTSHLERDFTSLSSLNKTNKGSDSGEAPLPSKKAGGDEDKDKDDVGGEKNNANANEKAVEDTGNVQSDTVERLKKRSERFKLPLPSEKEASTIKKIESEPVPLPSTARQSEGRLDSEDKVRPDRPARKRRWTGN